jgi:hypothetical protein
MLKVFKITPSFEVTDIMSKTPLLCAWRGAIVCIWNCEVRPLNHEPLEQKDMHLSKSPGKVLQTRMCFGGVFSKNFTTFITMGDIDCSHCLIKQMQQLKCCSRTATEDRIFQSKLQPISTNI